MVKASAIRPSRDAVFTALLVFAVAAAASIAVYFAAVGSMKQEIRDNLSGLAQTASHLTDASALATLTEEGQTHNDTYNRLAAPLQAMITADPSLAFVYTMRSCPTGICFVLNAQPKDAKAPEVKVMQNYPEASDLLKTAFADGQAHTETKPYTDEDGTFLSGYAPIKDASGTVVGFAGVDINVHTYNAQVGQVRLALGIGLLISLLCAAGCGFAVYSLRNAMRRAQDRAEAQDEAMRALEAQRARDEHSAAEDAARARKAAMNELAETFEASVRGVVRQVVEATQLLENESEQVTVIAEDTRERSQSVSRISSDAAQTSSQVAAASEELTASIREIRAQTEKSSAMVRGVADKGQGAKTVIERLSQSSSRIGEVVNVINDIASQINLLALNATIESARAGDAGKGFAVVANEVKSLSGQVSRALDEIATQVHDIQAETKLSVEAMNDILGSIQEISESSVVVASAVTQQSDVTREIAHNIHATAQGAREIADNMANVLQSAGQTGATADRVRATTAQLKGQSQALDHEVEAFLRRVRA